MSDSSNVSILIESPVRQANLSTSETYKSKYGDKFLGFIAGPGSDFSDPTRNNRMYKRKCWENTFSDEWIKELISTRTLFGELDHPFDDRNEVSIKEAAVTVLEATINDKDKEVDVVLGILDTPNGRITKSLLDSGCRLGISSRGQGELIDTSEGYQEVDPDSFIFTTFDVVPLPAVVKARPSIVEGVSKSNNTRNIESIKESILKEIDQSLSRSELSRIKSVIESTESDDLLSLTEEISRRLDDPVVDEYKVSSDLEEAYSRISELEGIINTIDESEKESDSRIDSIEQLVHMYHEIVSTGVSNLRESNEALDTQMKISNKLISGLRKSLSTTRESLNKYRSTLKSVTESNESTSRVNSSLLESLKSQLEDKDSEIDSIRESYSSRTMQARTKYAKLTEAYNKALSESKSYKASLIKLDSEVKLLEEKKRNLGKRSRELSNKVLEYSSEVSMWKSAYCSMISKAYNLDESYLLSRSESISTIDGIISLARKLKESMIRSSSKISSDDLVESSVVEVRGNAYNLSESVINEDDDSDLEALSKVLSNRLLSNNLKEKQL